ncbi:hypothetical protein EHM76_00005 [bacterium]|nr:MAG: hypothetical protein EHM76_00005 [bacterium]
MPCQVCTHPEVQAINAALIEHSSPVLALAAQHRLTRDVVNWHRRKHLEAVDTHGRELSPLPSNPSRRPGRAALRASVSPGTLDRARQRFIDTYASCGNVTYAAKRAGIPRNSIYAWQEHDEVFAAAFREADLKATEVLEREAWRRANEGFAEPVYQHGKLVGTVQRYSDNLLMFLLRARAPERYRDRVDVSVAPIIKTVAGFDPADVV